jgi:uncharacterized protein (TIGR02117 family)
VKAPAAALLAGWLAGCAAMPIDAPVPDGTATVYVVGRGWHTDIGLPVEQVSGPLASLEHGFPGIRFMVFGFGERAYYMGRDEGSLETLGALFPSKSAVLLTALNAPPTEAFPAEQVVTLRLPRERFDKLADLIWRALEKTADGSAVRLADGPYAGSVFYASSEIYDAFHTCNTWTALLLRDAGLPVDPHGVLFVGQVMRQAAAIAAVQEGPNR